jgi:hypothetical protein
MATFWRIFLNPKYWGYLYLAIQSLIVGLRFFHVINIAWWKAFFPSYIALCVIVLVIWLICKGDVR